MKSRLFSLFRKLASIQTAIDAEQQRAKPDWMRLFRLRRLRMMVKESLTRLSAPAEWLLAGATPRLAYVTANRWQAKAYARRHDRLSMR